MSTEKIRKTEQTLSKYDKKDSSDCFTPAVTANASHRDAFINA